jgi:radical SAM superfamily enzyme YgiQ (UPF0313 family)
MFYFPIKYDEPLFRPPSEAYSLILQVTIGCSWNKCSFCEMYTSKKFRVRSEEEIFREIQLIREKGYDVRKVFLADGNAMVLSTQKLIRILNQLRVSFPKLSRISAYAIAKDLEYKSVSELTALKEAGLKLIYVGIETGNDELLRLISKGESFWSTRDSLLKAKQAGIKSSVMILTGLGGKKYSDKHAVDSAKLINVLQPEFLSTLVLSFPYGVDHYKQRFDGEFEEMSTMDLLKEQHRFISELNVEDVIFRSDHASNYLALKGTLAKDKERLLSELETAIHHPGQSVLREEWERGL